VGTTVKQTNKHKKKKTDMHEEREREIRRERDQIWKGETRIPVRGCFYFLLFLLVCLVGRGGFLIRCVEEIYVNLNSSGNIVEKRGRKREVWSNVRDERKPTQYRFFAFFCFFRFLAGATMEVIM
jgi:hypothetical protein